MAKILHLDGTEICNMTDFVPKPGSRGGTMTARVESNDAETLVHLHKDVLFESDSGERLVGRVLGESGRLGERVTIKGRLYPTP